MSDVHSRLDPLDELTRAVDAARDGDDEAFRFVYRELHPGLLRYLRALVGDDAEDVASEVWLQIVRDLRTFVGDGDGFRGWAATIARRRALDHLRYHRRRPSQPVPVEALIGYAGDDDTATQAAAAAATDAAIALIATLPRDQAEAVLLRVVVGLDAQSAADVLGKRPGAVRTASYRGLRRLAKILDSLGVRDFPAPGVTRTKAPTLKDMR
ncbi:MAG TPA: RNA polymerase sigma factor [Micromonosporaceae bacterium]